MQNGLPFRYKRSQWFHNAFNEKGLMVWGAVEASLPFLPIEMLLIPLTRLYPESARRFVLLGTVASAIGGVYSYALGHFFERFVHWNGLHLAGAWFDQLINVLDSWGVGFVFLGALFPLPLSLVAIGAGVLHIGLLPFLVTIVISRAMRFYLVTSLFVFVNHRNNSAIK